MCKKEKFIFIEDTARESVCIRGSERRRRVFEYHRKFMPFNRIIVQKQQQQQQQQEKQQQQQQSICLTFITKTNQVQLSKQLLCRSLTIHTTATQTSHNTHINTHTSFAFVLFPS